MSEVRELEAVRHGSRWLHGEPSEEQVKEWFETVPLHAGMPHGPYFGGIVLISATEKTKKVIVGADGDTRFSERERLVYVPYVKVDTRIAYFWDYVRALNGGELRGDYIGRVRPVRQYIDRDVKSPYYNANLPKGFGVHVYRNTDNSVNRYLVATYEVGIYERETYGAKIAGRPPTPLLSGIGSKQTAAGTKWGDPNAIMKAQTGAIGRALGVAGILVVGSGVACVPLRTEILTRDGWKSYLDVEIGEEVLAYDPAADVNRWTPLRRVSVYGETPVVSMRTKSLNVICTADHKWAIRRKHIPRSGPVHELREAWDLARGGPSLVMAARAESGRSSVSVRDAAIVGWLITDGHIDRRAAGTPRATITQSKPQYVKEIRELLGAEAYEQTSSAGWHEIKGVRCWVQQRHNFRLSAVAHRALMARIGLTRLEELPRLVSELSADARAAMLDAMRKADGHVRGGGWVFTKGKRWVLDLFQMLCALEGRALGAEHPHSTNRAIQQHVRATRFMDAAKVTVTPEFPERVWCPTTDYGTWVARLDGQVFITGNTAEDMQEALATPAGPSGVLGAATGAEAAVLPGDEPQVPEQPSLDDTVVLTPEQADDALRAEAGRLAKTLQEEHPAVYSAYVEWWNGRFPDQSMAELTGPALRGAVVKLERDLDAARRA